ncbi:MAG: 2-C-methyl-D-erythritol 2,4-cyclodiphosphate synthase [Gemmatimonadetes bacterium]|nr:2-C-methyl-D-erythritol 2,4-cyclodiphosphate synthase [Gemmatimonadota bacterium]MCH8811310.1 2-C-methyl-D-erythritol 2,4-cyclodiphosphate synthase [Gemmatimonadota bacterium]
MRIGFGYDSHRFDEARPLVLGGVLIPDHPGLLGHSDGDAIAHAVTDALLGAAALGDIGRHFPPSEPQWKDVDSMELLARVVELIGESGLRVCNVDVTVITEEPKIAPNVQAMVARLSEVLRTAPDAISVKGKTNEGMGWIGSGEGMAVHAVALLERSGD